MTGLEWLPSVPAAVALAAYAGGVRALTRRGDRWPTGRTAWFVAGVALGLVAMLPPLADPPTFPLHIAQHLLLAMAAPLALARSAPATLALRTLPARPRRLLLAILHSRAVALLMWGPVVLVLEASGLAAVLLTGLFAATELHPWLHLLVHAHMAVTGCLLSWYLVGVDPVRHRASTGAKVAVLVLAAGAHDLVAKLLVAWGLPTGEPRSEVAAGAQLLYTGGDVLDALLMALVLLDWYRRGGRELARAERRRPAAAPAEGFGAPRRVRSVEGPRPAPHVHSPWTTPRQAGEPKSSL